MNKLNFSRTITKLRHERNITQEELAAFVGVTKASVSKWETAQSLPDILLLPVLASFFDISIDELIGYEPQLSKEQIRKFYHTLAADFAVRPFEAVMELSFSVPERSVYGFIGPNGAGKTTTMKMILELLKMDSGHITINGQTVCYGQNITNQYIGYLPDVPEFYGFLTPFEYLLLCGEITGMQREDIKSRSKELLQLVGLNNVNKRIHGFSRGMKQRLGIAQALLNRPRLLICDEPTSALDPAGRKEILDILQSVQNYAAVLFSTHILADVERICDEIACLHQGKLAFHGTMEEIRTIQKGSGFQAEFYRKEDAERFFTAFPGKRV